MAKKKSRVQKYFKKVERKAKNKVKRSAKKAAKSTGKGLVRGTKSAARATGRGIKSSYNAARVKPDRMIRDMRNAGWSPQQIQWRTGASATMQNRIVAGKTSGEKYLIPLRQARKSAKNGPPDSWIHSVAGVPDDARKKAHAQQYEYVERQEKTRIEQARKDAEAKAAKDKVAAERQQAKAESDAAKAKDKADREAEAAAKQRAKDAAKDAAKATKDAERAHAKAEAAKARAKDKLQRQDLQREARRKEKEAAREGVPTHYKVERGAEGEWVIREDHDKTAQLRSQPADTTAQTKPTKVTNWSQYIDKDADTSEGETMPTDGDQIVPVQGENTIIDSNGGSHLGNRVVQVILKSDS